MGVEGAGDLGEMDPVACLTWALTERFPGLHCGVDLFPSPGGIVERMLPEDVSAAVLFVCWSVCMTLIIILCCAACCAVVWGRGRAPRRGQSSDPLVAVRESSAFSGTLPAGKLVF